MELLTQDQYNDSYFDGKFAVYRHNAGYSTYEQGKIFQNIYTVFKSTIDFSNKKILDIGCAKGFLVELLRNDNHMAFGVDWSQYALTNAPESIKSYLFYGILPEYLKGFPDNEFDLVISSNFLCCFSNEDLNILIPELNRISKEQCHFVAEEANKNFYNSKLVTEWIQMDWKPGTIITNFNGMNIVK